MSAEPQDSPPVTPQEHGYGDKSDCVCGRNFSRVRGLREHLTKSRQVLVKEGAKK